MPPVDPNNPQVPQTGAVPGAVPPPQPGPLAAVPQSPVAPQAPVAPTFAPQTQPVVTPIQTTEQLAQAEAAMQMQQPAGVQPAFNPMPMGGSPVMAASSGKPPILKIALAAIAAIVLAVGGFFMFNMLTKVSAEQYKEANTLMDEARNAYNKMDVYVSSYSTETELRNSLDTMKTNYETYNSKIDELGDKKAIKKDGELANLYKAVTDKKEAFDTAVTANIEAYETVMPVFLDIDEVTGSSGSTSDKFKSIRTQFEGISGLKNNYNQQAVASIVTTLKELETLAVKVEAGRKDYRKYDSKAVENYYDAVDDLSTITRDWESNLQKLLDDSELRDELNALSEKIFEKSLKK